MRFSIVQRRHTRIFAKSSVKVFNVRITAIFGNLQDWQFGFCQKFAGFVDFYSCKKLRKPQTGSLLYQL